MAKSNKFLVIPKELLRSVLVVPTIPGENSGLIWVIQNGQRAKPGQIAGSLRKYINGVNFRIDWTIGFEGKTYNVARIIYTKLYEDPKELTVDHIDRNPLNNNINNLRLANRKEQNVNQNLRSDNKSGARGVTWIKEVKKWQAYARINNKPKHLGLYNCLLDAANAYNKAAIKYYPEEFRQLTDLTLLKCSCNLCAHKKTPSCEGA